VHGIVPGGGLALDADRWVPCKPGFFLPVRVLSRFFRRRFLLHVLPSGFHRIRHYGLLANAGRKNNIDTVRQLLQQPAPVPEVHGDPECPNTPNQSAVPTFICRHCGVPMQMRNRKFRATSELRNEVEHERL